MNIPPVSSVVGNFTFTLIGSLFIFIAFAIPASIGLTILTQIFIWVGLLIIFSDRAGPLPINRVLRAARAGLALNVCATFVVILFGRLLYSGTWWEHPLQVKLHGLLNWILLPLPTALSSALKDFGWQFTIPPDCLPLVSVFAFYLNVLLYILFALLFSALFPAQTKTHQTKTPAPCDAILQPPSITAHPPSKATIFDQIKKILALLNMVLLSLRRIIDKFKNRPARSAKHEVITDSSENDITTTMMTEAVTEPIVANPQSMSHQADDKATNSSDIMRTIPHRFHRWLNNELTHLEISGLIDQTLSARLRNYYTSEAAGERKPLAILLCTSFGAILAGLGIILILAHNWPEFSRSTRMVISFIPLLLGQFLAGHALLNHNRSLPWREGASAFLTLSIGASIALIGQTYHISGDLPRFLLTWSLLALPLAYLFRAALPTALSWLGLTAWCLAARITNESVVYFFPLMLLPAPVLVMIWRQTDRRLARIWLCWIMALCLLTGLGAQFSTLNGFSVSCFALLLSLYYLVDQLVSGNLEPLRRRPLAVIGCCGLVLLIFLQTFEFFRGVRALPFHAIFKFNLLSGLTLANLLALTIACYRLRSFSLLTYGSGGILMLIYTFSRGNISPQSTLAIFNLYLFTLGALTLHHGLRNNKMVVVNGAMIIFAMMITARFFDTHIPFTVKGVAFLLIGGGFLSANLFMRRRGVAA